MNELILVAFITLHSVDGREAIVNSEQITSMLNGKDGESNKLLVGGVNCAISLSSGKFVSVVEHCPDVLRKIDEAGQAQ